MVGWVEAASPTIGIEITTEARRTRRGRQRGGGEGEASCPPRLGAQILAAAIEVHKELGPGLLESAYEECLCYELSQHGLAFQRQVPLPVTYKGVRLDCGYRLDIVIDQKVVLELKSVETITELHKAQLLTYLPSAR